MKVISGIYKGRKIDGYNIEGTRPTMDRVKESLFATIQEYIPNSVVLDLFSGSGNLGIEAISEGASKAYLVDSNRQAIKFINANLKNMGITSCQVLNSDYQQALKNLAASKVKFDVIFLDPPYKTDFIEKSITLITKLKLLADQGIIVCESDSLDRIVFPETYIVIKEKKYGDKWVVILKQL